MDGSSSTRKDWSLTQESFDQLLAWLDPERERAGRKYEEIRRKLIKIFLNRGCQTAEELADETINRVAKRVVDIAPTYSGDPARYFYGVAQKVLREYLRKPPVAIALPAASAAEREAEYQCLEECMEQLSPQNRDLVLRYYQADKRTKIENRKELAQRLGIPLNALRIRACRLRATLLECIQQCLKESAH